MMSQRIQRALAFLILLIAVAGLAGAEEKIARLRVLGNYRTPDEEVLRIAAVKEGDAFTQTTAEAIKTRLRKSGRFDEVTIRVRRRSITGAGDVYIFIVVREKPPLPSKFMYGPILSLSDENGLTYGVRIASVDLLGLGERLYFPLTWGGEKQAAVEAELGLGTYDLSRVVNRLKLYAGRKRRNNPHFDIADDRVEMNAAFVSRVRNLMFQVKGGRTDIKFGGFDETFYTYGAEVIFDLRRDANMPGDALYLGGGWERLSFSEEPTLSVTGNEINRYKVDLRAFKRLVGQALLAGQFYYRVADAPLPAYEKPFLGGGGTLRGYSTGKFVGDNIALASLELRLPLTPVMAYYRYGIHFFVDGGAVFDDGQKLGDAERHYGVGVGSFLFAAIFGLKMDIAYDLEGDVRLHFGTGFRF